MRPSAQSRQRRGGLVTLALLGALAPAASSEVEEEAAAAPRTRGVFADRAALLLARDDWCANKTNATAVHGPIGEWDVSRVTDLSYVFCAAFGNCYTGTYEANATTHVSCELAGCNPLCFAFDEDISQWDTSHVTSLDYTFRSASSFNQPLTGWNTSQVTTALSTFRFATAFNQPLSWDTTRFPTSRQYTFDMPTVRLTATIAGSLQTFSTVQPPPEEGEEDTRDVDTAIFTTNLCALLGVDEGLVTVTPLGREHNAEETFVRALPPLPRPE